MRGRPDTRRWQSACCSHRPSRPWSAERGPKKNRDVARTTLEQVCARGDMALAPSCYAENFDGHVNGVDYRGREGVRLSTAVYRALFDALSFEVVDQVAESDGVASRFVVTGVNTATRFGYGGSRSAACATDGSSRTGRRSRASSCPVSLGSARSAGGPASARRHARLPRPQRGLIARIVEPIAPNFAALRRVSANVELA